MGRNRRYPLTRVESEGFQWALFPDVKLHDELQNWNVVDSPRDALYYATQDFMSRDYSKDVAVLNELIRKNRSITANLRSDIPPIPFTGDPWRKEEGNCMIFIGINPRFQSSEDTRSHPEFGPAIESIERLHRGEGSGFNDYLEQRKNYFLSGIKYGKHFSFPEKKFREHWYAVNNPWDRHVQSLDCIPWFSTNAKDFDNERICQEYGKSEAFLSYQRVLEEVVNLIKPKMIQLNGMTTRMVFEHNFSEGPYVPMEVLNSKKGVHIGYSTIGHRRIPTLSHNFSGYQSGPNGNKDWDKMISSWNDWYYSNSG